MVFDIFRQMVQKDAYPFLPNLANSIFKTCLLCIHNINIISYKYTKPLSSKIIKNFKIPAESEFYYYSISYLFTFLLHSLIHFENPKLHHGIYVNTDNGVNGIRFNYNLYGGFFERLVHILSLLDYPSSFSSFISDLDNNDHRILLSQKTDISISNKKAILLDKLLEHDFDKDYPNLESNIRSYILHIRYEKTSAILRDFILIFVACAITRYNPALWRNIYSGEYSNLIFYFEKSFNNINDMIRLVNDIITQAEEGTLLKNYKTSKW